MRKVRGRVRRGARLRYRVTVRNRGNAAARNVRVRVRLPRELRHLSGGRRRRGSRTVTFSFRRLAAGARRAFDMRTQVSPRARRGRLFLRASVTGQIEAVAARLADRTAAMPSARAPALDGRPRQRFVTAYGLCRVVIRD